MYSPIREGFLKNNGISHLEARNGVHDSEFSILFQTSSGCQDKKLIALNIKKSFYDLTKK